MQTGFIGRSQLSPGFSQVPLLVLDFWNAHIIYQPIKGLTPQVVLNLDRSEILPQSSWISSEFRASVCFSFIFLNKIHFIAPAWLCIQNITTLNPTACLIEPYQETTRNLAFCSVLFCFVLCFCSTSDLWF